MRRRPGALVPFERAICVCAGDLRDSGVEEFYGYALARALQRQEDSGSLSAYGALYRALGRLEQMGLLTSRWEDPEVAQADRRPLRRLYALTGQGETVVREARAAAAPASRRRLKVVPT